jgi:hypothetical protein
MNQVSGPTVPLDAGGGVSSGAGGFRLDLDTVERVLGWLERVGPLFDQFSERFIAIKQFENGNRGGMGDIYDDGQLEMIDNTPPGPPPGRRDNLAVAPSSPPAAAPVGNAPALDPMELYQILLGSLAQLPPETTAAEALELAKANKGIVLATIKQHLDNMAKQGW